MNIESQLDEWEDFVEDDLVTDMQDEMDQDSGTTRYTENHHTVPQVYSGAFGGSRRSCASRSRPPLCHPLSTRILNGNSPVLRLALRLDLTSSG
jgi:hypothetical protein